MTKNAALPIATDGSITNHLFDHKRLQFETDENDAALRTNTNLDDEYGDLLQVWDTGVGDIDYTPIYDAQGSVIGLLDHLNELYESFDYQAFGVPAAANADDTEIPYRFAGQMGYYPDQELGFYLLGIGDTGAAGNAGTYYLPDLGRGASEDPKRFASGKTNFYPYVGNDPVNRNDPSGKQPPLDPGAVNLAQLQDMEMSTQSGFPTNQSLRNLQQTANAGPAASPAVAQAWAGAQAEAFVQGVGQGGQAIGAFNNSGVGRTVTAIVTAGLSEGFRWAFPKTANFMAGGYGVPNALASVTPDPAYNTAISHGIGAVAPIIVASLANPAFGATVGATQAFGSAEIQGTSEGWSTSQTLIVGTERAGTGAVLGLIPGAQAARLTVPSILAGAGEVYAINVGSGVIDNKLRADLGLKSESDLQAFVQNATDPNNIVQAILFEGVRAGASAARGSAERGTYRVGSEDVGSAAQSGATKLTGFSQTESSMVQNSLKALQDAGYDTSPLKEIIRADMPTGYKAVSLEGGAAVGSEAFNSQAALNSALEEELIHLQQKAAGLGQSFAPGTAQSLEEAANAARKFPIPKQ